MFVGGAATAAAGWWGYKQFRREEKCDEMDADEAWMTAYLPLVAPDPTDPSMLPQTREEYRARVLEALWAVHPDCRGKTPRKINDFYSEPAETVDFEDWIDDLWAGFNNA